jgi:hypothetical protein
MTKIFLSAFLPVVLGAALVRGGDEVRQPERREFRQRPTYPFVFEPVAYLANGGPQPLRFGAPIADCSHRDAPPLPKQAEKKNDQSAAGQTEPATAETTGSKPASTQTVSGAKSTALEPAYQPQGSAPVPLPPEAPDFNKTPDEVLEYYKNPYNPPHPRQHLFDPIFEPAVVHKAEASKATYRQE